MEELFNVFGCSDEEKVNHATYGLSGPAIIWWRLEKSECKQGVEPWDNFKKAFCAQYIPDSIRLQMAEDLISLKQMNLTKVQYEAQFSKLARFVPTWVDSDEVVAWIFEGGLRHR
ncbi:hypothetical protein J3R85_002670 [Psidium guajava]|nr:hypothetical protein J3R85_002670 [Psidium guajava]